MENKMYNLDCTITEFGKIVSQEFCYEVARKTGFVQRSTSQLFGFEFAQVLMIPNNFLEAETLNSLALRMHKINPYCNLSAPALAQRINSKGAQEFMKTCFGRVLKEVIKKDFSGIRDLPHLSGFNRVLIEDSTQAELNEKLSQVYPGRGGTASKSAVKINYMFDYLSETFVDMSFHSGNMPDQSLASHVMRLLEKDDLLIRDLGYYALARLKDIEEKSAYYISRLKVDVIVYDSPDSKTPLNLAKFLERQMINGIVDETVYISEARHPVRLVACVMCEQAVAKKRRAVNRAAARRGRTVGKKASNLMKFCLFITNVPPFMLSPTDIMACYRARWRVELIFKQWKTCLKLHVIKGFNYARFHCLLYGRLIMILLLAWLSPPLIKFAISIGKELSTFKLSKYLIFDDAFSEAVQKGVIDRYIENLLKDLPQRLCMDRRRRKSLRANVRAGRSWHNDLEISGLCHSAA
jgi:DDE family transposase